MNKKHEVTPFDYNGHTLSTITDGHGEVWFVAKEVAEILDYSDAEAMTRRLDDDEKRNLQIVGFGNGGRGTAVINESGLYSAILGSTKPEAKPFKKWVTAEVLPSIRKTGSYTHPKAGVGSTALDKLRTANALKLAEETAAKLCARFSRLGESAQQVIYAKIINPIVGDEVLMLPRVDETLKKAGEVGDLLGVSGNKIGRLSNQYNMKTPEYGEFRLDKSEYSSKQVETFLYNAKAIERFRTLLTKEVPEKVVPISGDLGHAG